MSTPVTNIVVGIIHKKIFNPFWGGYANTSSPYLLTKKSLICSFVFPSDN